LLTTKRDPNTKAWHRAMLRHVTDRWGDDAMVSINHLDVQAWVNELEAAGRGPDTVRGAFRVLHETIALALRARIIGHDPCLGVRLPRVQRREMLFLNPLQARRRRAIGSRSAANVDRRVRRRSQDVHSSLPRSAAQLGRHADRARGPAARGHGAPRPHQHPDHHQHVWAPLPERASSHPHRA
jgi:predicted RNA-binding Zn ribbon-like protein